MTDKKKEHTCKGSCSYFKEDWILISRCEECDKYWLRIALNYGEKPGDPPGKGLDKYYYLKLNDLRKHIYFINEEREEYERVSKIRWKKICKKLFKIKEK